MFNVKKRTLLLIAGIVWLIAGFNVARLGVLSYFAIESKWYLYLYSIVVFVLFGTMFFKMSQKHTKRILKYEDYKPFWKFFDLKAYIIMCCMMGGGIGFRALGIFPDIFVAFFYSGLGCALALAGVLFFRNYICYTKLLEKEAATNTMTKDTYKPRVPDLMEAIFDISYLTFDLIAGILFFVFSKGSVLFILYGILTLTLCGGDAFHLVPRVIRAIKGNSDKIKKQLGIGLQISSITMTIFYIILLYIWKYTFYEMKAPIMLEIIIWASAIIRIAICFLPQNNWCSDKGNMRLSIIRNAVFAVTGVGVIILYAISGNTYGYHMNRMAAAIIISFGCYLPVTLLSKKMPKIGMLMIPKTCAYIWIIVMGLQLLF